MRVDESADRLALMAAQIVAAFVKGNRINAADVSGAIASVHRALAELALGGTPTNSRQPAVPIKKSVGDDFIVCLEDGKRLTMLKRYLKRRHKMTPEEYRKKWGLPHDYPMVAPSYARLRSAFAKRIGLGRTPVAKGRRRRK